MPTDKNWKLKEIKPELSYLQYCKGNIQDEKYNDLEKILVDEMIGIEINGRQITKPMALEIASNLKKESFKDIDDLKTNHREYIDVSTFFDSDISDIDLKDLVDKEVKKIREIIKSNPNSPYKNDTQYIIRKNAEKDLIDAKRLKDGKELLRDYRNEEREITVPDRHMQQLMHQFIIKSLGDFPTFIKVLGKY